MEPPGARAPESSRRAIALLFGYVLASTYVVKLIPLYAGYEGRGSFKDIAAQYLLRIHALSANLNSVALGPATLIFTMTVAVVLLILALEILLIRGILAVYKILFVFGTRPEAIKLCPVLLNLRQSGQFQVRVCVTAQHRSMLDQVLAAFDVTPDYDLDLMQPGQTLAQITARILAALEPVIKAGQPDMLIVQGDTTTTLAGALAAFYQHVPVGHVEAGLRTGDLAQPFPEEMNRVVTTRLAALHFAPTETAKQPAGRRHRPAAHLRHRQFGHRRRAPCA